MKLTYYIVFALALCFTAILEAKPTRFIVYDKPGNLPEELFMYVNGKLHGEITLREKNFGEEVEIKESGEMKILFSDRVFEQDEEIPAGYPTMLVPEGWSKFLTIAVGDLTNENLPLEFHPVNASANFFENSDYLIVNRSENVLVGDFGPEKILVGPKKMKVYKMAKYHNQLLDIIIDYVRPNDGNKRRWGIAKGWRVLKDRRTLVFFFSPPGRKTVTYFSTQLKKF